MTSKRQKKAGWKLPDAITGYDLTCVRLMIPNNDRYIQAFVGAVYSLGKWWNWEKSYQPGDTRAKEASEYWRGLLYDHMYWGCDMLQFRQNPANDCQLQASYDGGSSWTTVFDYSLCQLQSSTVEIANNQYETNNFNQDQMITYNNNITNIYPGWGYGDAEDPDRDTALCWAIRLWVDAVCDSMIRILEDEASETGDAIRFGGYVAAALGGVLLALSGVGVVASGLLYAGIGLNTGSLIAQLIAGWYTADTGPYEDQDAKDAIACEMYGALAGSTPTFAAWSNSLNYTATGNEEHIRKVVHDWNQDETNFVNFLGMVVDVIQVADAGIVTNECALDCGEYMHLFDFTGGLAHGWEVAPTGYNQGSLQSDGWHVTNNGIRIMRDFPIGKINRMRVQYTTTGVGGSKNMERGWGQQEPNGVLGTPQEYFYGFNYPDGVDLELDAEGSLITCDRLFYYLSVSGGDVCTLKKVWVYGTGDDPFD